MRAGEWDLHQHDGSEQDNAVKTIYIHSEYNSSSNDNDIALVYLDKPVNVNENVRPICLPTEAEVRVGQMCMVTGWGVSARVHRSSAPLFSSQLPVVSRQKCNGALAYGGSVKASMVCAGYQQSGPDSCGGDGGGPLMCQSPSGKWTLAGVSSWGEGCGLPGKYGVYTSVAHYQDWISRQLRDA